MQSPAAPLGNALYVGVTQKDVSGVLALACEDGLASKPKRVWLAPAKNPVTLSPAANDQQVFFVDGRAGAADRQLHCVNRQTGAEVWSRPVAADATGEFTLTQSHIYIADTAAGLTCLALSGPAANAPTEVWKSPVGPTRGMPAVVGDRIALQLYPQEAVVLDGATGALLWTKVEDADEVTTSFYRNKPNPSAAAGAFMVGARVWIPTAQGLRGYSVVPPAPTPSAAAASMASTKEYDPRSQPVLKVDCGPILGRVVNDGGRLACVTAAGELIVADAETGAIVARQSDALPGISPLLVDDVVLYAAPGALQRLDLRARQPKPALWARISATWPGKLLTPMTMVDSHIFVGTDKRGFICLKPKKE